MLLLNERIDERIDGPGEHLLATPCGQGSANRAISVSPWLMPLIRAIDASTAAAYGFRSRATARRDRVIVIRPIVAVLVISLGLSPP
jgi:hypothetical protein